MTSKIAFAALVVILVIVNLSIWSKEKHLAEGVVVYLELAPVDPRSLIQGDYMALRFAIADTLGTALAEAAGEESIRNLRAGRDGLIVVGLDARRVGSFRRLHSDEPLGDDEVLMRYRVRDGRVRLATDAFFFQEGHAEHYSAARYGQFRVDRHGELLLTAMHDENLVELDPDVDEPATSH